MFFWSTTQVLFFLCSALAKKAHLFLGVVSASDFPARTLLAFLDTASHLQRRHGNNNNNNGSNNNNNNSSSSGSSNVAAIAKLIQGHAVSRFVK